MAEDHWRVADKRAGGKCREVRQPGNGRRSKVPDPNDRSEHDPCTERLPDRVVKEKRRNSRIEVAQHGGTEEDQKNSVDDPKRKKIAAEKKPAGERWRSR